MIVELNILSDLYSPPVKNNRQKLIKEGIVTKMLVNTSDIKYIEETFDKNGKIQKNVCAIKIDQEIMRVKNSYNTIKKLILPDKIHTGFKEHK